MSPRARRGTIGSTRSRSLAAQIAHEVRNPLGSIVLNAELLEDELHACIHASPEVKRLARAVSAEAERLTELTDEYLAFARPLQPRPAPQPLAPLLDEVVVLHARRSRTRADLRSTSSTSARRQPSSTGRPFARCCSTWSATRSTPCPSGGVVTAPHGPRRRAREDRRRWTRDREYRQDRRDAIFEPFSRTKPQGTGLGLAVAAQDRPRPRRRPRTRAVGRQGAWFRLDVPGRLGGPPCAGP